MQWCANYDYQIALDLPRNIANQGRDRTGGTGGSAVTGALVMHGEYPNRAALAHRTASEVAPRWN